MNRQGLWAFTDERIKEILGAIRICERAGINPPKELLLRLPPPITDWVKVKWDYKSNHVPQVGVREELLHIFFDDVRVAFCTYLEKL